MNHWTIVKINLHKIPNDDENVGTYDDCDCQKSQRN